ncbi:tryptophan--tRNA ligase [Bacillus testis]|uniref:tryptophan--tRNA ligase n=1 Tax=Bacillus testis TaxID=1622072 RepID=UPI00067EF045|nr:tryptophan--tRNA ligase [Bacillus testis]
MKKRILTGIKPTGQIHLGNYMGAIKPALELAKDEQYDAFYFIADYHGLTRTPDPEEFKELSYGIAATWIALGLDYEKSVFYRQSDIPEVFELNWILACYASKGLMNRAHAYKAIVDENKKNGNDLDDGVNMGLFTYPILMAADILLYNSNTVPVGKDQIQHVEIARDLAQTFNKKYGATFNLPEYKVDADTAVLPGLDGRKMSKSYNNTIPLFSDEKKLLKLIKKIKTDSSLPGEPKDPDQSNLFSLYKQFADAEQIAEMRTAYEQGISWGEAKQQLFEVMNEALREPRERYQELMGNRDKLDQILKEGAEKARSIATPMMKDIRTKIGL